ncbi:hypothetical protein ACFQ1M_07255 [Sungkyunkwania multivorans]|uniref:Uncharacterized protein n=1 Tax=Sungkyunkwania multivorans TaxID=1173618 RepID=A0ABW3CXG3_9FLAO
MRTLQNIRRRIEFEMQRQEALKCSISEQLHQEKIFFIKNKRYAF